MKRGFGEPFLCGVPLGNEGIFAKESGLKVRISNIYCSCIIIIRNETTMIEFVMKRGFGEPFLCGVPLGNDGIFAKESGLKVINY